MVYQVEDGEADHEGVKVSLDSNSLVEDVNGGLRVKHNKLFFTCKLQRMVQIYKW